MGFSSSLARTHDTYYAGSKTSTLPAGIVSMRFLQLIRIRRHRVPLCRYFRQQDSKVGSTPAQSPTLSPTGYNSSIVIILECHVQLTDKIRPIGCFHKIPPPSWAKGRQLSETKTDDQMRGDSGIERHRAKKILVTPIRLNTVIRKPDTAPP